MRITLSDLGGYELDVPEDDHISQQLKKGEPFEFELLRVARGGQVVDMGAHVGNPTVFLAKSDCHVTAFEPKSLTLEFLKRNVSLHPDMMKIDVEGAEFAVIEGASAALSQHQPALFIELHRRRAEMENVLERLGYRTVGGSWADSPTFLFVARRRHKVIAGALAVQRQPRRALRHALRSIRRRS